MCSTIACSARALLALVLDRAGAAEQHHRAVVGGVVHRRAREHQTVDQRDGQAGARAGGERPHRATRQRAVAVDDLAVAGVQHGDHERLAVLVDDAQVGDQCLVEDRVDRLALVAAPFALAPQAHALGWRRGRRGSCHVRLQRSSSPYWCRRLPRVL